MHGGREATSTWPGAGRRYHRSFHYQPLPCLWLCLVSKRNVAVGGCMERETYGVRYSLWFRAGTGVSELGGRGAMCVRVTYVRVCPYGKPRREVTGVTAET